MLFVAACLCEEKERAHASLLYGAGASVSGWTAAPYACLGRVAGLLGEHIYLLQCVCECVNECVSLQGTVGGSESNCSGQCTLFVCTNSSKRIHLFVHAYSPPAFSIQCL